MADKTFLEETLAGLTGFAGGMSLKALFEVLFKTGVAIERSKVAMEKARAEVQGTCWPCYPRA